MIQAQVQVTYRFSDGSGIISILALIENESENPICREQWENLGDNWVTMSNPLNNAYITQLFEFVSKVLLLLGEISCTTGFFNPISRKGGGVFMAIMTPKSNDIELKQKLFFHSDNG